MGSPLRKLVNGAGACSISYSVPFIVFKSNGGGQTQENKLGLSSRLGCGIKTPQSLGERLTLTLTGPVTEAAPDSEGQALSQLSAPSSVAQL